MSEPEGTRDPLPPGQSRLPALGRRGGGWVGLQLVVFALVAVAGWLGMAWPPPVRPWLMAASAVVAVAGMGLLLAGGAGLGSQLTPFPRPVPGGELRRDGVYGLVRHPIYGGVLLLMLAWGLFTSPLALAPWALGVAFFDSKRRREEAWLADHYPGYADYRHRVRWAFVPFVW